MFTEQEVFAKIGYLSMLVDKQQQTIQELTQAQQKEEKDEPTGNADGR